MTTPDDHDLQQYHAYLLSYALLQLRDRALAEDVVQETLLAALEGRARFAGKSSHKTWLTGILKHKIIDTLRRRSREQPLTSGDDESESDAVDALFAEVGAAVAQQQVQLEEEPLFETEITLLSLRQQHAGFFARQHRNP